MDMLQSFSYMEERFQRNSQETTDLPTVDNLESTQKNSGKLKKHKVPSESRLYSHLQRLFESSIMENWCIYEHPPTAFKLGVIASPHSYLLVLED